MNRSYCIGLMSGTSLDGVDLVYVALKSSPIWESEIIHAKTYAYPQQWIKKLKLAFEEDPKNLGSLNRLYGQYLGRLVNEFILEFNIDKVAFIASHGHTIFHKPQQGFTLQLGDGAAIAKETKTKVVCDFRTADVKLGGQGAPLVPIGDALLFSDYDYCLNLGGFANVSFVEAGKRLAYDICPVNIVLNHYTRTIGEAYDDKGTLAKTGVVHKELLELLNQHSFFNAPIPKSLGYEFVAKYVLPAIDKFQLKLIDVLRTYVEHIAFQLSRTLGRDPSKKVLVTGGGGYNDFLIERLRSYTCIKIVLPSPNLIEFKEALIFALLGKLRLEGKVNCLKSVTGASKDHSSGEVYFPL